MVEAFSGESPEQAEEFLAKQPFLSGQALPGAADAKLFAETKEAPCRRKTPFLFAWWWGLSAIPAETRESWAAPAEKKEGEPAEKKEEPAKTAKTEEDDLFGDDGDAQPAKPVERREKKVKAPVVHKSRVIFDVKGYEVEQDFKALGEKIKQEVNMEGLVWQNTFEVLPLAYGMNKLRMTMIIEDAKVSADDVFEKICSWEDEVQSCDTVEFNKA